MSNGFPVLMGEQNFESQGTSLFAQAQNFNFAGNVVAYFGAPVNQPLDSPQNVYGIIGRGNGKYCGVLGWGDAGAQNIGGEGPGPGVVGAGGIISNSQGTAQVGGDGVVGLGGASAYPGGFFDNVVSGEGVVGLGGNGAPGFELPNPDNPQLPGTAYTPRPGGIGVYGGGGDGSDAGVIPSNATGVQASNAGIGVVGQGGYASGAGQGSGVVGTSIDESAAESPYDITVGIGVAGWGGNFGVYGFSGAGIGVAAATYGNSPAIEGVNLHSGPAVSTGIGVRGSGPLGGFGVVGQVPAPTSGSGNGAAIHGSVTGSSQTGVIAPFAGLFDGPVKVNGSLDVTGTKSAAVPFPDGSHRRLYCMESPDCWFEDFGDGELVEGKAYIELPRDFATVIKTDSYHVFLTPYGRSNGLYVSERTGHAFVVEEQGDGKSDVKFSFRIVGKRKDVEVERFAVIAATTPPKSPQLPPIRQFAGRSQKQPPRRRPTAPTAPPGAFFPT
jgi:hypothetical protein